MEILDGLSTRCFFMLGFFGAGAGTGHFFLKLLGADARAHPGFSERELIHLDFSGGEIVAINDVGEQCALTPFCPVRRNPGFRAAVSPDFVDVSYLLFQKARPAMSVCDISFSCFVFLATAIPLTLQLWDSYHALTDFARTRSLLYCGSSCLDGRRNAKKRVSGLYGCHRYCPSSCPQSAEHTKESAGRVPRVKRVCNQGAMTLPSGKGHSDSTKRRMNPSKKKDKKWRFTTPSTSRVDDVCLWRCWLDCAQD